MRERAQGDLAGRGPAIPGSSAPAEVVRSASVVDKQADQRLGLDARPARDGRAHHHVVAPGVAAEH